jgi:hypothetical protein
MERADPVPSLKCSADHWLGARARCGSPAWHPARAGRRYSQRTTGSVLARNAAPLPRARGCERGAACDRRRSAWRIVRATPRRRIDPQMLRRRPHFTEAAQRRSGVLEGEPSAMLPAVSAALAEWSPGRTLDASERSMQTPSERSMQAASQRSMRTPRRADTGHASRRSAPGCSGERERRYILESE